MTRNLACTPSRSVQAIVAFWLPYSPAAAQATAFEWPHQEPLDQRAERADPDDPDL